MAIGPVATNELYLGQNHLVQRISITRGDATNGGTFRLAHRGHFTAPIAYNAIDTVVQAAIRTLPDYENAVVTSYGITAAENYWIVEANADVAIVTPLKVYSKLVAVSAASPSTMSVTATTLHPLAWRLPANGFIRANVVAPLAQKTLIPGTSSERASQTKVSEWVIDDQLGGLGIRDYAEVERVDRFRDGSATSHIRKQLTLGFLEYAQTYSGFTRLDGTTAVSAPDVLLNAVELNGTVYGWFTSYNAVDGTIAHLATHDGETTWTQKTLASGGDGTDATKAVFRDARVGTNADMIIYSDDLWIFTGNTYVWKYSYTTNAVTSANLGSAGVISGTVWDQKLVRLDLDGALYTTTDGSSWTANAIFSESTGTTPIGQMLCVRTWRNLKGMAEIYVYHDRGLHAVDLYTAEITKKFETSGVGENVFPARSVAFYQGDLHYIASNRINKYDLNNVVPTDVENDQGLPYQSIVIGATYANNSRVVALFATNQWLFASYRGVGSAWQLGTSGSSELGQTTVLEASWRAGMVLGFNGRGWHPIVPYNGSNLTGSGVSQNWGHVMWYGDRLYYRDGRTMRLVDYSVNPLTVAAQTWATRSYHMTGWFDRGLSEISKTAYHCTFRARDLSSTSTIRVYYQLEGAPDDAPFVSGGDPHAHWVPLLDHDGDDLVINETLAGYTSGIVHGHFNHNTLHDGSTMATAGISFYAIRLLFRFDRSTDSGHETETPILEAATVTTDAHFEPLLAWDFSVDIAGNSPDGRTSAQQRVDAERLLRAPQLHFFSYLNTMYNMVHVDQIVQSRIPTGSADTPGFTPVIGFTVSERMNLG